MINKIEPLTTPSLMVGVETDGFGDVIRLNGAFVSQREGEQLRAWLDRALCICCTPIRKCPDHGACVADGHV